MSVRTLGIVVAGGSGTRLGADVPKALVRLAGAPLVWHAATRLVAAGCDHLAIAAPASHHREVADAVFGGSGDAVLADGGGWTAVPGDHIAVGGHVMPGGVTRQASVALALGAADPRKVEVVLVHDAARPLAPVAMIRSVIEAVRAGAPAVIPGLGVTDTIKRVVDGVVSETIDRTELVAVQTPQGFDFPTLYRAHRAGRDLADDESTAVSDDAGLVERFLDVPVLVVPGAVQAMKITTAADLAFASTMLAEGEWT
jgi:2-C-methyl-D-erythritol 4-phosphate cytidylyltransferase